MSNIKESQNEVQSPVKPQLCIVCQNFFGSAENDNCCSQCFKKQPEKQIEKKLEEIKIDIQEKDPAQQNEKIKELQQIDVSRCWGCNKKVGYHGFMCKCGFVYCKSHRMPEEHQCSFDFKKDQIEKLKTNNPVIKASQIAQI